MNGGEGGGGKLEGEVPQDLCARFFPRSTPWSLVPGLFCREYPSQ